MRLGFAAFQIVNQDGNGFRGMAGGFEGLQTEATEFEEGAIGKGSETIFCLSSGAKVNSGANAVAEFEVASYEIGVEMRQDDVLDLEAVFGSEVEIALDVALGIDDNCDAGGFVANQIGGVGETVQVELIKNQGRSPSFGGVGSAARPWPRAL